MHHASKKQQWGLMLKAGNKSVAGVPGLDESGLFSHAADSQTAVQTIQALGKVPIQAGPLISVLSVNPDNPDAVAEAIEASPALAGRLLCVTNSAGMGLARHIDCVRRAVIHLGATRARLIALAFGLRMISEGSGLDPDLVRLLWVNSLRKAAAARLAAQIIDPAGADRAWTTALLQDIGLPMLVAVDPTFYSHFMVSTEDGSTWSAREIKRFGIDHAEIGKRLLEEWKASARTCDAVSDHHQPPQGTGEDALERLPQFIASLMPHLTEQTNPAEQDWIVALHGQFLAETYPSPDAFFAAAAKEAARLHGSGQGPQLETSHVQKIVRMLSRDVETMVSQLCQLEDAVGRQREHLSTLRSQAFTDQLTKLLNRRGFASLAQRRLEQAVLNGTGACMVIIDMDDFKPVNDRFGHEAGDLVLRALAKILRRNLDRSDLVGRLGGDEFVALFTGTDEPTAQQIIERVSDACSRTRVRVNPTDSVPLRLSIGASYAPSVAPNTSVEDLIAFADEAMYNRKRGGKGGICFTRYTPKHK